MPTEQTAGCRQCHALQIAEMRGMGRERKTIRGSSTRHFAPTALMRSVGEPPSLKAGLLAYRSSRSGGLPIEGFNSGLNIASPLTVHSGATARDFNPLPFSLTD